MMHLLQESAEREVTRFDAELKKTTAELTKVSAEFLRQKEWTLVVKKVGSAPVYEASVPVHNLSTMHVFFGLLL